SDQIQFSTVQVLFSPIIGEPATAMKNAHSPFPWINQIGARNVLDAFGRIPESGPRKGLSALVPGTGLAAMNPPKNFLAVQRDRDEFKAITSDESKLWIREIDDAANGSLSFWTEALKNHLTNRRGYSLIQETSVKDKQGRAGRELQFEVVAGGEAYRYQVTLFVTDAPFWSSTSSVQVTQFLARREQFDVYLADVREAGEIQAVVADSADSSILR
ncbi:MAG: hypothetical protein N2C14_00635, partial [Planctomycetales bacterium]